MVCFKEKAKLTELSEVSGTLVIGPVDEIILRKKVEKPINL